jgi:carbamoyltransferase
VIILGVWDGHDAGAALVVDGAVVAAVNEERLSRRKLEVRFPSAAIAACLELGGVSGGDVDLVAACGSDVAKTLTRVFPGLKERYYRIRRRQTPPGTFSTLSKRAKYWLTELGPNAPCRGVSRLMLRRSLQRSGISSRLAIYDHHACHAAAGACLSGFQRAVVVTFDGVGDGRSSTVSVFDGRQLQTLTFTSARHSPGIFFEHVTNLLNMRELEDEGKVMALANYAAEVTSNPLEAMLRPDGMRFRTEVPGHALFDRLRRQLWHFPNEQFARMAQDALQRACVDVVREAVRSTGLSHVVLSGGVASNIQVNRRVRLLPDVDEVFVCPHMGDGGLALGAALMASLESGEPASTLPRSLALGPEFSRAEMARALADAGLVYDEPPDVADAVTSLLLEDQVVFWFEGRMEYGPRALGHRSIIARADRPDVRDRLNITLKRRVWYQPFCPSILESDARRLFSDWKGSPNRHMTMAYSVHHACRGQLAGVLGVDGTCRPQIVEDGCPSAFGDVLRAMQRKGGVGAVLNTSFNIHGEPLVCSPPQAADVFRRSGADAMAIGPYLVRRPSSARR